MKSDKKYIVAVDKYFLDGDGDLRFDADTARRFDTKAEARTFASNQASAANVFVIAVLR